MDFLQIVMTPFSLLMKWLYFFLFENYGLAIIVFAFIIKVILFPLSLKGKKGMIQMNMLSGQMQQIQKKYAKDKERQNLEIQKLYEKEKVNPMSGCLWSFLPLLILFPLYALVRRPLRYLMSLNDDVIGKITQAVTNAGVTLNPSYPELSIVSAFHSDPAVLAAGETAAGGAELFGMNFNFLGIDLSATPTLKFWENGWGWDSIGLFLIPVIIVLTSFLSTKIMNKTNQMNGQQAQNDSVNSTNKMMMWLSPLMMLWISFVMPAGMGIYIIANSVFSVVQELVAGKILKKDYEAAAAMRAEQERLEKEEEKKKRREAAERKAQAIADGSAKKGKKGQQEKRSKDASVIGVSGVGTRAYARGRAYDPYRYSADGPTPYRAAGEPVDEGAAKAARVENKDPREELVEELIQTAETAAVDQAPETAPEEAPADTPAPEEDAAPEDPWAKLDQEIQEIQTPDDGEEPKE